MILKRKQNLKSQDVFFNKNGRRLGDIANDILVYGGKIYITVGLSSTLEITDLELNSVKKISLTDGSKNREPHGLACHNGKVYIACFDGTLVKIDTASLTVENVISVGANPENICVSKGFAYITNSGGMDYIAGGNHDSTVSVVNLTTFTETKKITVGKNPFSIGADENGDIIVGCRGDYGMTTPFSMHRISTTDHSVYTFTNVQASDFAFSNAYFYTVTYNLDWTKAGTTYTAYNTIEQTQSDFLADPNLIESPYAINFNSENSHIYISDAVNYTSAGRVFVFNPSGEKQYEFETGIAPKKIVVLKK